MDSSSRKLNPEWIVAISAVIISLCALGVSVFQTRIMKEQQAHSVWPHVQIYNSNLNGIELTMENKGVGPAIIQNANYSFDGKSVDGIKALMEVIRKADPTVSADSNFYFRYSDIQNIVLGPGDEHMILEVKYPEANIILRAFNKIGFKLCYCSIQDDCWNLPNLLNRPEPGCD